MSHATVKQFVDLLLSDTKIKIMKVWADTVLFEGTAADLYTW